MIVRNPHQAISSVYGKIEQLLLSYPGDPRKATAEDIELKYGNLFQQFGDRVTFVLLGKFGDDDLTLEEAERIRQQFKGVFSKSLEEAHLNPDHHVIHLPAPMAVIETKGKDGKKVLPYDHSAFIQDPFVVLENRDGHPVLLESYRNLNPKNDYVAEQVAASTGAYLRPTALLLEGGNVLVGNDYALIGKSLLQLNADLLFEGKRLTDRPKEGGGTVEEILINRFREELGVRYMIALGQDETLQLPVKVDQDHGPHLQPFFHLDHFIMLAGLYQAGGELIFVAELEDEYIDGEVDGLEETLDLLNDALDQIANTLRASGRKYTGPRFEVRRLPMGGKVIIKDDGNRFIPFPTTNGLVEWYHGVKRIYLPHYPNPARLRELEKEIAIQLRGLGFPRFEWTHCGLEAYAKEGGSLHCLAKVLKRSPY